MRNKKTKTNPFHHSPRKPQKQSKKQKKKHAHTHTHSTHTKKKKKQRKKQRVCLFYTVVVMDEVNVGVAEGLLGRNVTAETNGGNGAHGGEQLDKVGLCDLRVQVTHV